MHSLGSGHPVICLTPDIVENHVQLAFSLQWLDVDVVTRSRTRGASMARMYNVSIATGALAAVCACAAPSCTRTEARAFDLAATDTVPRRHTTRNVVGQMLAND